MPVTNPQYLGYAAAAPADSYLPPDQEAVEQETLPDNYGLSIGKKVNVFGIFISYSMLMIQLIYC